MKISTYFIHLLVAILLSHMIVEAISLEETLDDNTLQKIESSIHECIEKSHIPGLAITIVKNGRIIFEKGYGYANIMKRIPVSPETLFEIGSTTKAFTGLAILKLAQENRIDLNAPIDTYLPWFHASYNGEKACIRVCDCLYHTSGIPFHTMTQLKASADDQALEETIKHLNGIALFDHPSKQFQYATINYDILGLLIQVITKQSYENYMRKEILEPLNLANSYFNREQSYQNPNMAVGYKWGYFNVVPFQAPSFKGNTPAGYLISNSHDIGKWLLLQMHSTDHWKNIFLKSHEPNQVATFLEDAFYSAGWLIFNTRYGEILSHTGNNPNFSSYFSFSPSQKIGVAVLANLNSNYSLTLGQTMMSILTGNNIELIEGDMLQNIASIALYLLVIIIFLLLGLCYLLTKTIRAVYQEKRRWKSAYRLVTLAGSLTIVLYLTYLLMKLPSIVFFGLDWETVNVWGPLSLPIAIFMLYTVLVLLVIYEQIVILFPRDLIK